MIKRPFVTPSGVADVLDDADTARRRVHGANTAAGCDSGSAQPGRDRHEFTAPALRGLLASVIAQFFGGTLAIGLFPLLMLPISAQLGWSLTTIGAMAGISALAAAIGMPVWGSLVDRYGARPMLLTGLVITGVAFFMLSALSASMLQGFLSYALIGFSGALSVVHVKAQSARFDRRRGFVLALLAVAIGLSFGVTPLLAKPLLDTYGWRAVYAAFGLCPLLISLPLTLAWFRDMPAAARGVRASRAAPGMTLRQAIVTPPFWIVVLFSGCSGFVFIGLQAHVVAFLEERGLTSQGAVEVLSLAVGGALACQLTSGWLLDRFRSPRVALIFVGAQMAGVGVLLTMATTAGTAGGILLLNAGSGGELSMLPYLLSRTFGVSHLARIYGVAALLSQLCGGLSPILLGAIHDHSGTYSPALPLFAGVLLLGGALILLMPPFSNPAKASATGS